MGTSQKWPRRCSVLRPQAERRTQLELIAHTWEGSPTRWTLLHCCRLPESYHDASQPALLPRMFACASGIASDFPLNDPGYTHARSKPSLKMRLLCLASIFGLVGTPKLGLWGKAEHE